jgi:hypothetical protein
MFRVPVSGEEPTFDDTFKVSFWKWLTSKSGERREWAARRNAAAKLAGANQVKRFDAYAERKAAEKRDQR